MCGTITTQNAASLKISNKIEIMKNLNKFLKHLEFWILENFFQNFSDFTYRRLRLTNFFWAVCSVVAFIITMLRIVYKGLVFEHDPMVILAALIAVLVYIPSTSSSIKEAWYASYDEAMVGKVNSLKTRHSEIRTVTLSVSLFALAFWLLLWLKHRQTNFAAPISWIFLSGYPTYCFCSCTPPMRENLEVKE